MRLHSWVAIHVLAVSVLVRYISEFIRNCHRKDCRAAGIVDGLAVGRKSVRPVYESLRLHMSLLLRFPAHGPDSVVLTARPNVEWSITPTIATYQFFQHDTVDEYAKVKRLC